MVTPDIPIIVLLLLFPLLGFLVLGTGFRKIPVRVASWIGPGTVGVSFLLAVVLFMRWQLAGYSPELSVHDPVSPSHTLFTWFASAGFSVSFGFLIDPLSLLMILIVTGIGLIIHIYSIGYMKEDTGYNRFFSYMNLFVFSMLVLVLADNYLVMFIGWEGVGLCSYLLIGFWFRNQEFNNAAKKAFVVNRIGDLGFLIGIFLIFTTFGTLNYSGVFSHAGTFEVGDATIVAITMLLFIGATGKSAQIPLYTWLPDAMAGPTPVSALIHAATMVTAGVYMVARSGVLYVLAPPTMTVVAITGLVTAVFAASIAISQNDIKKILAYSTISQLGFMFLALGVGAFTGAMFHLTTHAFFKALLFLAAGSVIHALGGEQDIRKMGGLKEKLPGTYYAFLIGTLAIAGIPPFSGFFSKDEILLHAFSSNFLFWIIGLSGSLMTAFYMFRMLNLTFFCRFRGSDDQWKLMHKSPVMMMVSLIALALLSAFGGFLNIPSLFGGKACLEHFLRPVFAGAVSLLPPVAPLSSFTEIILMVITLAGISLMIYLAFKSYVSDSKGLKSDDAVRKILPDLLFNKYFVDELYQKGIMRPFLALSGFLTRVVEIRMFDGAINGIGRIMIWTGSVLRYIQTGHVGFYIFMMLLGIIVILVWNVLLK